MCNPVLPAILGAGALGYTAVKKAGSVLSPKIGMPAPEGPQENVEASASNAANNARRRALLAYGANRQVLAGGSAPSGGGKQLLGS